MANDAFLFDNAEPMDDATFHDTMELASADDQDDESDDARSFGTHEDEDDDFRLDGYDNLDDDVDEDYQDELSDYSDVPIGKKRKRVMFEGSDSDAPSSSKNTKVRIKVEGGESFILEETSNLVADPSSSRVFGTFGRKGRQKGESLPAYHKKVTADLDSDDELMLKMRDKGYSDRQIADKLAKDGRVRYDQKSISTRIMRIRLAQAEKVDVLLQEGYKEWEFEDDQHLVQAYALADIEINYEIERVRAWRFRKVSEYMRRLDKDSLFSANACRARYGELISGKAIIPTEVDDDPDARRAERDAFRQYREAIRAKEAAEHETREAMEKRVKDSVKIKHAQKAEEIANKRAAMEAEKVQRAMQRAAQAQLRMQKATENQKAKTERNAQIKEAVSSPRKRNKTAKADENTDTPVKQSTSDTVDPRSYLFVADLTKLCAKRGLPVDKPKASLVASLVDADMEWDHNQLRKMCNAKGITPGANKAVMRYQLALKAAQMCPSFEAGMRAAEEKEAKGGDDMVVDAE